METIRKNLNKNRFKVDLTCLMATNRIDWSINDFFADRFGIFNNFIDVGVSLEIERVIWSIWYNSQCAK